MTWEFLNLILPSKYLGLNVADTSTGNGKSWKSQDTELFPLRPFFMKSYEETPCKQIYIFHILGEEG